MFTIKKTEIDDDLFIAPRQLKHESYIRILHKNNRTLRLPCQSVHYTTTIYIRFNNDAYVKLCMDSIKPSLLDKRRFLSEVNDSSTLI